jgi:hypothetical protein
MSAGLPHSKCLIINHVSGTIGYRVEEYIFCMDICILCTASTNSYEPRENKEPSGTLRVTQQITSRITFSSYKASALERLGYGRWRSASPGRSKGPCTCPVSKGARDEKSRSVGSQVVADVRGMSYSMARSAPQSTMSRSPPHTGRPAYELARTASGSFEEGSGDVDARAEWGG